MKKRPFSAIYLDNVQKPCYSDRVKGCDREVLLDPVSEKERLV